MIHLGIKKIERFIRIAEKFYYPIGIEEHHNQLHPVFGASFGFDWEKHSISLCVRPSLERLHKIDVFATVVFDGITLDELTGNIDVDKDYFISMLFDKETTSYTVKIYPKEKVMPCINFVSHYTYPAKWWGNIRDWQNDKIILSKS